MIKGRSQNGREPEEFILVPMSLGHVSVSNQLEFVGLEAALFKEDTHPTLGSSLNLVLFNFGVLKAAARR